MIRVEVDGTTFAVKMSPPLVAESMTGLRYDPATGRGYQTDGDGRRVALTSYAAFGADMSQARELAERWCDQARRAWEAARELVGGGAA